VKKYTLLVIIAFLFPLIAAAAPAFASVNSATIKSIGSNGASSVRSIDIRFALKGALADQSLDCGDLSNKFSNRIRFKFSLSGKMQAFQLAALVPTPGSPVSSGLECNVKLMNPLDSLALSSSVFKGKPWVTGSLYLQIDGKTKAESKFRLLSQDLKPGVSLLTPVAGKILGKDVLLAYKISYEKEFTYTGVQFNVCLVSAPTCEVPQEPIPENASAKFRTEGKSKFYVQPKSSGTFRLVAVYQFTNNSIGGGCQTDPLRCVTVRTETVFSASTQKVVPVEANYIDITRSVGSLNLKCNYARSKSSFQCRVKPQINWLPNKTNWYFGDSVPTTGNVKLYVEVLYGSNRRYYERFPVTVNAGTWSKYFTVSNKKWSGGIINRPMLYVWKGDSDLDSSAFWESDDLLIGKY
jgi:hypothetical protein